jgi:hypothetical protein
MKRINWLAIALISGMPLFPTQAQTVQPVGRLAISVTHIDRNENGFLISVDIMNRSNHSFYLRQAAGWPVFKYRPQFDSLDVQQWSDGKTNLSPIGLKLRSISPGYGYFSIGPCRDVVSDDNWIRLAPGNHISDQIQAFEPSLPGVGNSVCPMRFAHFSDKVRVSVTAFPSAHWRADKALTVSTEFPLPKH